MTGCISLWLSASWTQVQPQKVKGKGKEERHEPKCFNKLLMKPLSCCSLVLSSWVQQLPLYQFSPHMKLILVFWSSTSSRISMQHKCKQSWKYVKSHLDTHLGNLSNLNFSKFDVYILIIRELHQALIIHSLSIRHKIGSFKKKCDFLHINLNNVLVSLTLQGHSWAKTAFVQMPSMEFPCLMKSWKEDGHVTVTKRDLLSVRLHTIR